MCQSLEDSVSDLQEQLKEKDSEIAVLRSQVSFLMAQQHTLMKALRLLSLPTFSINIKIYSFIHTHNEWQHLQVNEVLVEIQNVYWYFSYLQTGVWTEGQ